MLLDMLVGSRVSNFLFRQFFFDFLFNTRNPLSIFDLIIPFERFQIEAEHRKKSDTRGHTRRVAGVESRTNRDS